MPDQKNELVAYQIAELTAKVEKYNDQCRAQHDENHEQVNDLRKDFKQDTVAIHEKLNKIAEQLSKIVLLDQKINEVAKHSDAQEKRTSDYDVFKQKADRADVAVSRVGWALVFAIITAILAGIGLKG
ncbi:MAG TPA: hypothetical protein VFV43_09195 [Limnobacter sp.]|nr:hypothetical protein [Limnobacter sp.]